MKLITKYNRVNIIATVIALLASGICYYFFIHYELINQLDKDLKIEELEIKIAKEKLTENDAKNYEFE